MPFAKVVLGLPIEGPFDYSIPEDLCGIAACGSRVKVSFGREKKTGYITGISATSRIKGIKPLLEVLEPQPLLSRAFLELSKQAARYYCCAWGEVIDTALPVALRAGKKLETVSLPEEKEHSQISLPRITLLHASGKQIRWQYYLERIRNCLSAGGAAIVLLPDLPGLALAAGKLENVFGKEQVAVLCRSRKDEIEQWLRIRSAKAKIAVGTRSAVFAPFSISANGGIIILEDENDPVYKQDQVPHYHAREIAVLRSKNEGFSLVLGSVAPGLESINLVLKEDKKTLRENCEYLRLPGVEDADKAFPEVKLIDTTSTFFRVNSGKSAVSRLMQDSISSCLESGGKALLFVNRHGFSTFASCPSCGHEMKCQRCDVHLIYHFQEDLLKCPRCVFKTAPSKMCPSCGKDYIRYAGSGTEKLESELCRIFPKARVRRWDDPSTRGAMLAGDIVVSTAVIARVEEPLFDLIGVLSVDAMLNRMDFRSAEKVFLLLCGLCSLTSRRIIIQTALPAHHAFSWLVKKDPWFFYREELAQRKQLDFPPYRHFAAVKLRGPAEDKVIKAEQALSAALSELEVLSCGPGQPPKLRGNFYRQIILRGRSAEKMSATLKNVFKDFRHSGIIVTVDMDPV